MVTFQTFGKQKSRCFNISKYSFTNNYRQEIVWVCYNEFVISDCITIKRKEVQYEVKKISEM